MPSLSKYISEGEFTRTQVRNVNNSMSDSDRANAVKLCTEIIDVIRTYYKKPLTVLSGFRCESVNKKVGGSSTSQHRYGNAMDFYISGISLKQIFNDISSGKILDKSGKPVMNKIDQLIFEFDSWIHVGRRDNPRHEKFRAYSKNKKTIYENVNLV